ncbi:large-conductance mechanosensitive channel protein MscL [Haloferula sp. A504]|uniref:large-conductance mechanosensitive channel protein MscL n=1 Tax=Haloferula sp. A504 TaxID=3373601 RepID=UPI0031C65D70|nr:large-conductance mechanosensitive channel protein MscL [Verrucomicrobiaceae bacterium E54]
MIKEFKEFAFKGNVMDMAVGIIIGGAFGTVVKSLVDNVLMPPLGKLIAGVDFTKLKWVLEPGVAEVKDGDAIVTAAKPEVAIAYGQFITDSIAFLLLAFAVFLVVKKLMVAMQKKEEEEAAPAEPPAEEKLLTEIRDLLKEKA